MLICAALACSLADGANIKGRVTCEGFPVAGVRVTDGVKFTLTGEDGRYAIQSDKTLGMVYICVPDGYTVPLKDGLRPDFWQYLHLPADKEEIHDFRLVPQNQDRYRMILMADVHLANDPRRDDINRFMKFTVPLYRKLHEQGRKQGAVFTCDLGDLTHDYYWYQFGFREMEALLFFQDIGLPGPFMAVAGNHDHDPSIVGENVDWRAGWMQRECWGPDHYSMDIGGDHWLFIDNMLYINRTDTKAKRAPGVNGDRYIETRFRPDQIAWIVSDLSMVDSGTRVFVCCHCPLFSISGNKYRSIPEDQMAAIAGQAARLEHGLTFLTGHMHRWESTESPDWPKIYNHTISATSGDMWETLRDWKISCGDGSDAGLAFVDAVRGEDPVLRFETYEFGEKAYRVLDMNEVGRAYRNEPAIAVQQKKYPLHPDYSDPLYRNCVMVNYWRQEPGDVVEIIEKGRTIKGECGTDEDPTKNFAWDVQVLNGKITTKAPHKKGVTPYSWLFNLRSAKAPFTLVVRDSQGREKYREEFTRPIPFDPSGRSETQH